MTARRPEYGFHGASPRVLWRYPHFPSVWVATVFVWAAPAVLLRTVSEWPQTAREIMDERAVESRDMGQTEQMTVF